MKKELTTLETYISADWQSRLTLFLKYPGLRDNFIRFEMNNSPQLRTSQPSARINPHPVLKIGSAAIAISSLIMFVIFMVIGPRFSIPLNLSPGFEILFDIFLCMLFFLQHSLMTRPWFKSILYTVIPKFFYPLLFSFMSGVTLLIVIFFWQGQTMAVFDSPGWLKIIFGVISVLCAYGLYRSVTTLGGFDPFGLRTPKPQPQKVFFQQKGPYRWVRHPLYLFSFIFIWSTTSFTPDRIVFNLLWSIWIIVGTWLEDRDILNAYPNEYGSYQTQVPMIIPTQLLLNILLEKN